MDVGVVEVTCIDEFQEVFHVKRRFVSVQVDVDRAEIELHAHPVRSSLAFGQISETGHD